MAKDRVNENVIEWIDGDKIAICTFSQKKFVNRIRKMVEKGAPSVEILHENDDGSIMAKIPLKYIHLTYYKSNTGGFAGASEQEENDGE